jgi:hypothetical protein
VDSALQQDKMEMQDLSTNRMDVVGGRVCLSRRIWWWRRRRGCVVEVDKGQIFREARQSLCSLVSTAVMSGSEICSSADVVVWKDGQMCTLCRSGRSRGATAECI